MADATTLVNKDESRNRFFTIYLSCLGTVGLTLMVLTYFLDWGFWGWFGGGFLAFAGFAGLGSMAMTGGAGKLPCPNCQGEVQVLHISQHRIEACPHCGIYLEGAAEMAPVPPDRVADRPAFYAVFPDGAQWPEGCPVCGDSTTRRVKVEGRSVGGTMAAAVSPISVQKVVKMEVPACDAHDDGVALFVVPKSMGKLNAAFRSHDYWRKFCELNATQAPKAQ